MDVFDCCEVVSIDALKGSIGYDLDFAEALDSVDLWDEPIDRYIQTMRDHDEWGRKCLPAINRF